MSSNGVRDVAKKYKNVEIVLVTISTPIAVRWTRILKLVTTKYILLGRYVSGFSHFSDIERLIRVLLMVPDAAYVAGSTREESGRWRAGCYQSRLELYGLTLNEGYLSSDLECMYCDAVDGPFLTTTALLKSTPLYPFLLGDVAFHDWFLRLRNQGMLGFVCPDVLFFVTDQKVNPWNNRKLWNPLAVKWGVTHIHLPQRIQHHYTCQEARLDCGSTESHLAIPPCCLARLGRELSKVVTIIKESNLTIHIMDHTVDSGIKGGLQPVKAEAHVATTDNNAHLEIIMTVLKSQEFQIEKHETKPLLIAHTNNMTIFLHLHPVNLTAGIPFPHKNNSTLLAVGGSWLPAPPNPGLYVRGRLGPGCLRHITPGDWWPVCTDPGHHACLDRLPQDGTLTKFH